MGREIKFRGKRIDNGEWAYGYFAVHKMMLTSEIDYFIIVNEQRPQSVDPKTVGQYTGLNDIDRREIYEGDIILHGGELPYTEAVDFREGAFGTENHYLADIHNIEVIGNIYENLELLP